MVKKLIKYDFLSYMRKLLPMELILLGVALLTRFVLVFEDTSSAIYNIVFTSSMIAYVITLIVCLIAAFASVISRFYKNMFTGEGYLSFTLPIKSTQHLDSKLISGVCVIFATILNAILSFIIVMSGDPIIEIFKAVNFLGIKAVEAWGAHFWFYVLEILLYVVLSTTSTILLFYACTCVGQLAKKNRVLMSFLTYFVVYFVTQIVETILILIISVTGIYVDVAEWFVGNMLVNFHVVSWLFIIGSLISAAVYYLVCAHIMDKKVNLE